MSFLVRLTDAIRSRESLLVVGLDPNPELLDSWRRDHPRHGSLLSAARQWIRSVIRDTADHVCAYKPSLGFYQALGPIGLDLLREVRELIPPDLPLLVRKDLRLLHLLRRLPGRKIVLTNAPQAYAAGVIRALGIGPALDGVLTIEDMQHAGRLMPKPSRPMLRKVLARLRLPAQSCVLVEDTVDNLRAARHCGVRTVWVSGIVRPARPLTQRHRRGHGAVDVHLKSVVELARTALARPTHERQLHA